VAAKAPTVIDLVWSDRLTFDATLAATSLVIDSGGVRGPSPVELLGAALAGCMSVDLAHILKRGRHEFTALRSKLVAERSPDEPHRITSVTLHFVVEGPVPAEAITRAIELSRTKYCSVWHSMRQDIDLRVTFEQPAS
jgi:putative redox protein